MNRERVVLGGLLLAALALRLAVIDATDLWLDEACSVHYATLDWAGMAEAFRDETHPPLFYLALRGWIALVGPGTVAVRLLSVLTGLLTVVAGWRLARRLFGPVGAVVAAGVLAFSPLGVYYSVEARPYAPVTWLVLEAVDRWLAWQDARRARDLILYALAATGAAYAHYYALTALPLVPLAFWVTRADRRLRDAGWAVLPLAALLPWLAVFGGAHAGALSGSKGWMAPWWARYGAGGSFGRALGALVGTLSFPSYLGVLGLATRDLGFGLARAALTALLAGGGLLAVAWKVPRAAPALAVWLLAPIALPVAASLVGSPVFVPGRYELVALPAVALLAGGALGALTGRALGVARLAFGVWAVVVGVTLAAYASTDVERPLRLVQGLLARERATVGEVLAVGFAYAPFRVGDLAEPTGVPIRPVPPSLFGHPGWEHKQRPVEEADLPAPLGHPGDVWLLSQQGDGFERWSAAQGARLTALGFARSRAVAVGDLRLEVYAPPATGKALPAGSL